MQKASYSKPLHNKSRCLNTMNSYLQSHQHLDIPVFSKSSYYETLAKHPVHDSDFVLLYIHRARRWIKRHSPSWRTNQIAWITKINECVYTKCIYIYIYIYISHFITRIYIYILITNEDRQQFPFNPPIFRSHSMIFFMVTN